MIKFFKNIIQAFSIRKQLEALKALFKQFDDYFTTIQKTELDPEIYINKINHNLNLLLNTPNLIYLILYLLLKNRNEFFTMFN